MSGLFGKGLISKQKINNGSINLNENDDYLKNNIEYEKSNFNVVLDGGDVRRKCIGTRQAFRD